MLKVFNIATSNSVVAVKWETSERRNHAATSERIKAKGQPVGCPTYLLYHIDFCLSIRNFSNFLCLFSNTLPLEKSRKLLYSVVTTKERKQNRSGI